MLTMSTHFEVLVIASVLTAVLAWLVLNGITREQRRGRVKVALLVSLFSLTAALAAHSLRTLPIPEIAVAFRPISVPEDDYVSSDTCQSCHQREHATWFASYHRTMTQVAGPQSILGDFGGVELELDGKAYRMEREEDFFWVEIEEDEPGSEGEPAFMRRPVLMTTGSHHVQLYWYPIGRSRNLGLFPFAYLVAEDRWVPRRSIFILPPKEKKKSLRRDFALDSGDSEARGQRWPDEQRWNHTCIHCHTTRGQPHFQGTGTELAEFDSRMTEPGIACESCHGPGREHVRRNQDPRRRYHLHLAGAEDATIVEPRRLDQKRASQVCGNCHGITYPRGEEMFEDLGSGRSYRPGDDLEATRRIAQPSLGRETLRGLPEYEDHNHIQAFWPDDMIRVKGREYNGLLDSPCYQRGEMSCFSCHAMHQAEDDPRTRREWANDQLGSDMEGNHACLQCHSEYAAPERLTAHTGHAESSSGSQCYNCHMTYTTYGLLKAIRSHQVDSPSVATSLATGRPNACNQCHLDKTLAWGAEHLAMRYGQEIPEMDEVERGVPASLIWLLSGDAAQRGLIAWTMGWEPAREASDPRWMTPFLAQLLVDPYDAVRYNASEALLLQPGYAGFAYDFIASEEERRAAFSQALEIWRRLPEAERRDPSGLLEGQLPDHVFSRLLSQRNDRLVALAE